MPLELPAADVGEVDAVRRGSRAFIQKEGLAEALARLFCHRLGGGVGVLYRRLFDGDEGNDVYRAHAGMLAAVLCHIDEFQCLAHRLDDRGDERLRLADDGDHRAVVVGIGRIIEQFDPLPAAEAGDDLLYLI